MNWLEIMGVLFLVLLSSVPLYMIYHIVRGIALAFDYTLWCLRVNRNKANPTKITARIFLTIWRRKIFEMIGFDGNSTKFHANDGSTWNGFGTGR